jgi:hypothetical protein
LENRFELSALPLENRFEDHPVVSQGSSRLFGILRYFFWSDATVPSFERESVDTQALTADTEKNVADGDIK